MGWSRRLPWILVASALPSSSLARDALRVSLEPIPMHVQGEASPAFENAAGPVANLVTSDSLVYSNTHYNFYIPNAWFAPGAGVTFADDLHLTLPGRLTQFWFLFTELNPIVVPITVSFYENDAADGSVGKLLAGPYSLGPYRWGSYRAHITVRDTIFVGRDLWFAMRFESDSAGAGLANPPFVGNSHDLYYDFALGRIGKFQGALANIYMQVRVEPQPVGIATATWSQVKALYRPAPRFQGPPGSH